MPDSQTQELPELRVWITREQLVRYAGASGDFNQIHYSDHFARELGQESVIAHGMLTMGLAMRVVTDWCGGSERVRLCSFRFSRPVPVPDDAEGAEVVFTGTLAPSEDRDEITLVARAGEVTVGRGRAEVSR